MVSPSSVTTPVTRPPSRFKLATRALKRKALAGSEAASCAGIASMPWLGTTVSPSTSILDTQLNWFEETCRPRSKNTPP